MRLQFLGCGDAFGTGGRFNTCFYLETSTTHALIDCGASSLIAMKRFGVAPNAITTILITHLHADHFGGLPFFILDAQFAKRSTPLTIAGPPGLRARLRQALEVFFPGSSQTTQKFDLTVLELEPRRRVDIDNLAVTPYEVYHDGTAPFFALRVETDGRVVTYSGDTEWCDALADAACDADLFVCEAYFYDKPVKTHLDLATLEAHLPAIHPRRLVLTHMSPDMLARAGTVGYEAAEDGKIIEF